MSNDYDIAEAEDFAEGWEALQDALASDEEWARFLYESFNGQDA